MVHTSDCICGECQLTAFALSSDRNTRYSAELALISRDVEDYKTAELSRLWPDMQ